MTFISIIQTRGVSTVSRVRVIGDPSNLNLGAWLETAVYYDEKGRPIQTVADNYKGGQDASTKRYDFNGKLISSYLLHNNPTAEKFMKYIHIPKYRYSHEKLTVSFENDENYIKTQQSFSTLKWLK